ncbi:hypothetical protein Tco_0335276 [Tanacetum coccineum]
MEESEHEDASDTDAAPNNKQQVMSTLTMRLESNSEMETSRREFQQEMMAISQGAYEKISWNGMMQKEIWKPSKQFLFAKQSETKICFNEDLEQIDELTMKEMDIKLQDSDDATRMKKFYKKTGRRVRVRKNTSKGTHDGKKKRDFILINIKKMEAREKSMSLLLMDRWGLPNINTDRTNINSVRPRVNAVSSNVNVVRSRQPGNWGSAIKTSACYNWRNSRLNSNCDSGPTFIRTVNAKGTSTEEHGTSEDTSTKFTEKEILTEPQQGKKISSTDTLEDNPKIQAFRRDLEEIALKHLGTVPENNSTSTPFSNTVVRIVILERNLKRLLKLYKMTIESQAMQDRIVHKLDDRNKIEKEGEAVRIECPEIGSKDEEDLCLTSPSLLTLIILKKVYKWSKLCMDCIQAPRAWILKKFDSCKCETTIHPSGDAKWTLTKDEEAVDVDVHFYRSMIGSLMYLIASRPDIMYAVCVCSRFQVTHKTSHLNTVKRIFKYLKGKPNLGLWYPRESPFDLEAFSDSDYGGSNLDRKSTTGGCQFLGQRLISWQCKKQTIVATSTTEAEYVAAANCCGQVLWVQNQLLDYGFNFMNTKIHIDNESTICIVKNPVYHSKTKHIEIRHHFIRDCYEKKLISVEKIHTDLNVADLLTKPFDGPRFNYLVVSIGFAEIVDFLRGSNLRYALTTNPTIYDSLVKQFWQSATANTKADGTLEIKATIDTIRYTISEASIRESLQLEDATGITMLPNDELFEGMGQIGYPTDGTFTFWKSFFTPQWRYLVHHLLHCISSKSGGWDQFGSNIATALICLSTGRVYNFSKLIFDGMVANLKSKTKFLMYPRFLQMILNIQTEDKHLYLAVSLTKKIFGNMKRGFRGAPRPLLPSMLLVATNPNAGQEHAAVAQSQPSSSTPQVQSTPPPPIPTPTPPPIPTPTPPPIPTPTPIPDTEPTPFEHVIRRASPVHHNFSPPTRICSKSNAYGDLLHEVP